MLLVHIFPCGMVIDIYDLSGLIYLTQVVLKCFHVSKGMVNFWWRAKEPPEWQTYPAMDTGGKWKLELMINVVFSLRTFDDSISRCFESHHLCIVVETGCAIYVQGKPLLFYLCGIIPCLVWVWNIAIYAASCSWWVILLLEVLVTQYSWLE